VLSRASEHSNRSVSCGIQLEVCITCHDRQIRMDICDDAEVWELRASFGKRVMNGAGNTHTKRRKLGARAFLHILSRALLQTLLVRGHDVVLARTFVRIRRQ